MSRVEMKQIWNDLDWNKTTTKECTEKSAVADTASSLQQQQESDALSLSSTKENARKQIVYSQVTTTLGDGLEGQIEQSLKLSGHLDIAVDILRDWHQLWKDNPSICRKPTLSSYTGVIFRLQKESGFDAAEKAEQVLELLLEMVDRYGMEISNNAVKSLYQVVIQLYTPNVAPWSSHIKDVGVLIRSANRAEGLLRSLEDRQDVISEHMIPNKTFTYTAVFSGYARAALSIKAARKVKEKNDKDHLAYLAFTNAQRVDQLLTHMETRHSFGKTFAPNKYCYKAVLTAWSTLETLEGANRSHAIMLKMDAKLGHIDSNSFSTVLQALGAVSTREQYHPDNENHPAVKALQTLYEMEERRSNGQDLHQQVANFNVVIRALGQARLPQDVEQDFGPLAPAPLATSLVLRLQTDMDKDIRMVKTEGPDLYTYGNLLLAWSHHPNHDEAVDYILSTVERMERLLLQQGGEHKKVPPGVIAHWLSSAMGTIAKSTLPDAPQHCEAILDYMEQHSYHHYKHYEYVAAILAWSNPKNPHLKDRAVHAKRLLKRLAKPNLKCYTAVLRACTYHDKNDAQTSLAIAEEIYHEAQPNPSIFGRMMDVYIQQMPAGKDRDERLRQMFDRACKEGRFHFIVAQKLEEGASHDVFLELIGETNAKKVIDRQTLKREDFPPEWMANVVIFANGTTTEDD